MKLSSELNARLRTMADQYSKVAQLLLERIESGDIPEEMEGDWCIWDESIRHIKDGGDKVEDYRPRRFLSKCDTSGLLPRKLYTELDEAYFSNGLLTAHRCHYEIVTSGYDDLYSAGPLLQTSYVRYVWTQRTYAKFYSECVPDSRMLVLYNQEGGVMARAMIYDNVQMIFRDNQTYRISFLDEVDHVTSHDMYLMFMIAMREGINLAMDYGVYQVLAPMEDKEATKKMQKSFINSRIEYGNLALPIRIPHGYHAGVPGHTRFNCLGVSADGMKFYMFVSGCLPDGYTLLGRVDDDDKVAITGDLCPRCGAGYYSSVKPCEKCGFSLPLVKTDFGRVMSTSLVEYGEYGRIPKAYLDENGELFPFTKGYLTAQRLAVNY